MFLKFLSLFHLFLCIIIGYGEWYLIVWFLTKQPNPLEWTLFTKIMYLLFSMFATEIIQKTELKITIKRKGDE